MGRFILCSDSYNRLEQGILPEFLTHIKQTPYAGNWNQSKHVYTLGTGGIVFVRSLDSEESINGIHATAIVCDEGLLLPQSAWYVIESRVVQQLGRVLVTSTPYRGKRWAIDIIERWKAGDPNYFVHQAGSIENPSVSKEEIERQRQRLPRWRFEMDYLGLFTQPEGIVYGAMRDCLVDPAPLPDGKVVAGVDWGHGGAPSAAIVGILDKDNVLWIFWELYWKPQSQESSFNGFARRFKQWHNEFYRATGRTIERIYCDSANDNYRQLRAFRLSPDDDAPRLNARPAKKGAQSVAAGIDMVSSRIAESKLNIIRGAAPALLAEAENYCWEVDEEDDTSNVLRGASHSCDALRYLCMSIDRKRPLI